ncbi:UbiA-like polyprenyltransferase [Syntrophomonas palmitatica]|uniref:UbiA-like polyprenyltransferase n=1 Tax=Syntrophomonas palmitatica TaxID=402877 RepID=UPI0009FA5DD4|nr:UbiA-like polyprenyltransferase [Syntrophomonas palmitatica]
MGKITDFLNMVDFQHTLFGLPFAYLGAFLAAQGLPTLAQFVWITLAMIGARTAALCLNRLIDLQIDASNPRTAGWVMPAGKLSSSKVWLMVFVCFGVLFLSAWNLNLLCFKLAPLAVLILWLYSYTKRFTWWCHFILGLAIGIGPIGAWIAISGVFDWQPLLLGLGVACWIAGFDTMYACQDIEFDRRQGLHSIPARFGEKGALIFSAVFHGFTIIFLTLAGFVLELGFFYYSGIALAAVILIYEHILVKPGDLSRVNFASFKINRYVGLLIFIATTIDLFV